MNKARVYRQLRQLAMSSTSFAIALFGASMAISLSPRQAQSSEKVIFTYGGFTQSISRSELQDFADSGEISNSLETLLDYSNQKPFLMRWILRQEFPANTKIISDLLNTAPGEYVLSQTGNVVGSKAERANVTALRGALIKSASDNNLVSLMELLANYPTEDVYVNGKILATMRGNLNQFVEETSRYIKIPLKFPQN
ncbi:MAG: alpha/beta hydrolase [Cyanobacteria bacterium J06600_6]